MLSIGILTFSLIAVGFAGPVAVIRSEPPVDAVFIPCEEGTKDPICLHVKQPIGDVITEISHPNGTIETKVNLYTRSDLQAIREKNGVTSTKYLPGQNTTDAGSAEFIRSLTRRESAPPICRTETQRWYDTYSCGYWYQAWHQVGNCFYCNQCTEAISVSFGVTQTWTYGLSFKFDDVITATFGFSWGPNIHPI